MSITDRHDRGDNLVGQKIQILNKTARRGKNRLRYCIMYHTKGRLNGRQAYMFVEDHKIIQNGISTNRDIQNLHLNNRNQVISKLNEIQLHGRNAYLHNNAEELQSQAYNFNLDNTAMTVLEDQDSENSQNGGNDDEVQEYETELKTVREIPYSEVNEN